MAQEDSFPPHHVPTLTEVVPAKASETQPEITPRQTDAGWAPPHGAADTEVTLEAVTAEVIRQLSPELERLIVEAVTGALYDQLEGFDTRVRQVMTDVVSKTLARRLA
jgi:hypothetical protein